VSDQQQWQSVEKPAEGEAVCFELKAKLLLSNGEYADLTEQGFLICHHGQFRAWKNSCPHAGAPLDWTPGKFFSEDGQQLVCHVHFAHFDPLTGDCLSGPCLQKGLSPLEFNESDNMIQVPVSSQLESSE